MPKLTLIRGLPGAGKSTMAKAMVEADPSLYHFEADQYFVDASGKYEFVPAEIEDAHTWCFSAARAVLEQGSSVVVSNTFTRKWEMESYLILQTQLGIELEILEAKGNYKSIHGVPQKTIDAMRSRWEEV
jgi:predicted kinase